jgi:hypothetical protein
MRIVASAQLGRLEEARDWLNRVLALEPGLTIAQWRASLPPHISPEPRYVEGLRKAGLPEG